MTMESFVADYLVHVAILAFVFVPAALVLFADVPPDGSIFAGLLRFVFRVKPPQQRRVYQSIPPHDIHSLRADPTAEEEADGPFASPEKKVKRALEV